jgi:hypothetical protein
MIIPYTNYLFKEKIDMTFKPTQEQTEAVKLCETGVNARISAFSGASKTTTLSLIAEALHKKGKNGLYVAYNKAIASEAKGKFPASVDCRTIHSLAFANLSAQMKAKLKPTAMFAKDFAKRYGFRGLYVELEGDKRGDKYVGESGIWLMVKETIANFCRSDDDNIHNKHFGKLDWMHVKPFLTGQVEEIVVKVARKYWKDLIDPKNDLTITHDVYLKLYGMSDHVPDVDYIMLDEAQDANAIMVQILKRFPKQVIVVGDRYQNIYSFNKTVNILDTHEGQQLYLTKSFRFGNNVQEVANYILNYRGSERNLEGNGKDNGVTHYANSRASMRPDVVICRTNAGCLEAILEYSELYPDLRIGTTVDAKQIGIYCSSYIALKEDRMKDVKHNLLMAFKSFSDYKDYMANDPDDAEIRKMDQLIQTFGDKRILASLIKCTKDGEILITTAHKSKGLEWDNVVIYADYYYSFEMGELTVTDEELNVIYVAVTRAKVNVDVSGIADLIMFLRSEYKQNSGLVKENNLTPKRNSNGIEVGVKALQIDGGDPFAREKIKEFMQHVGSAEKAMQDYESEQDYWLN